MATAAAPQANPLALVRQQVSSMLLSDDAKRYIIPLLPQGVSLERVVSTIHQVVADNPEILDCTPASIVLAVGTGLRWKLDFGETVHLVPFNTKVSRKGERDRYELRAKALRDYKGDIEMVTRSGAARDVQAHCFYEKEHFIYHQGTSPYIEHHPVVDDQARGKMLGAYAWALISQRQPLKIVVMSVAEIDTIRKGKSKQWKEGPLPDWYARKTMVHQVTKTIPKNRRLEEVEKEFEREEAEDIPDGEFEVVPVTDAGAATSSTEEVATSTPAAAAVDDTPALVEDGEPDPATLTIELAKAMPLLGPAGAWGGQAGKPLDSFGKVALQQIRKWCVDQTENQGDDPAKLATINAIDLIIADRSTAAAR